MMHRIGCLKEVRGIFYWLIVAPWSIKTFISPGYTCLSSKWVPVEFLVPPMVGLSIICYQIIKVI